MWVDDRGQGEEAREARPGTSKMRPSAWLGALKRRPYNGKQQQDAAARTG